MAGPAAEPRGVRRTFRALAIPNYRLFFAGQCISVTGTWMQRIAQDWLILELGGGPVGLSVGVALQSVPILAFGMWGGLLVDRFTRLRRVLLTTQLCLGGIALTLGLLTVTGRVTLPAVYAAAFVMGCVAVVDAPARQSFVLDMVEPGEAANAVSLNSSINNAARLIGPAVAGIVIGAAGTGVAYLVNAATFVAIVVALLRMNGALLGSRPPVARGRGQVIGGLRYACGDPVIRTSLLAILLVSVFAQNFRITLPLLAVHAFGGGAGSYGGLMSALGLGALTGALICAYLARPSMRMVGLELIGFATLIALASAAPSYVLMIVAIVGVGAGSTSFNTTSNALILLTANPQMRGRVASIRTLVFQGATPLGSVGIGWLCSAAGPRIGLAAGAAAALAGSLLTLRLHLATAATTRPAPTEPTEQTEPTRPAGPAPHPGTANPG